MIVAITGGGGFIGQQLVGYHLSHGDSIRVLTRDNKRKWDSSINIYHGNLSKVNSPLLSFVDGADVVYHCAAELHDKRSMHAVNVEGTARLIDAASGRIGRWVQLSSVGCYGPAQSGVITEASVESPFNLYEQTKTIADELVIKASASNSFEAVLLRPSIVYGQEMPNHSLFQLFSMIERGLFFFIGPRGASANYIHVTDVAKALVLCATHPSAAGKIYILSNWATIESLIESVSKALERPTPRMRLPLLPIRILSSTFGSLPKFPLTKSRVDALTSQARYSTDKIFQELGFSPQISVCSGMADLARWWKINKK